MESNYSETVLANFKNKSTQNEVRIHELTKSERIYNALITTLIGLGLTLFVAFIPFLSFIALIPLAITIVAGVMSYMVKGKVVSGQILCPSCEQTFSLKGNSMDLPHEFRCPNCSMRMKLVQLSSSAA